MPPRQTDLESLAQDANDHLRRVTHQIRVADSDLAHARYRKRLSNVTLMLGPVLLVLLFEVNWVLRGHDGLMEASYVPGGVLAVSSAIAALKLKVTPGGKPDGRWRFWPPRDRTTESDLELHVAELRDQRKVLAGRAGLDIGVRRIAYRDDAYSDVAKLRGEGDGYRRVNNMLQGVLIIGSLAATGASAVTGEIPDVRWATLGITFVVGISSGFMGYFKFKEKSFYLQQTADAIEMEWEAVEVGIGQYKDKTDPERLEKFAEEVHRLKSEQKKRQQSLEQPQEPRTAKE